MLSLPVPGSSLELEALEVPEYQVAGQPVQLGCKYHLQDDQLYSVTWYRNNKEFFRYVPDSKPPMTVFNLSSLVIDVSLLTSVRIIFKWMES